MTAIALIPARGGSQRIPRKNIRLLAGKPLIAYTVEAARKSRHIARIIVSTENAEIAQVAKAHGAEVLKRPASLAQAETSGLAVMQHALHTLAKEGKEPDILLYLQPTSPLRTSGQIDQALALLQRSDADAVISVREAAHPGLMLTIADGYLRFVRQDAATKAGKEKTVYQINGALYAFRPEVIKNAKTYAFGKKTLPLIMDKLSSIDIDTEDDWKMAECMMRHKQG